VNFTKKEIKEIIKEELAFVVEAYRKKRAWKSTLSHPFTKFYTGQELLDHEDLRPLMPTQPFDQLPDGTMVFNGLYRNKYNLQFRRRKDDLYELYKIEGEEVQWQNQMIIERQ